MIDINANNKTNKDYNNAHINKKSSKIVENSNININEKTIEESKDIAEGYRGVLAGILYKSPKIPSFSGQNPVQKKSDTELNLSRDEEDALSILLQNKNVQSLIQEKKIDSASLKQLAQKTDEYNLSNLSKMFENDILSNFISSGDISFDNVKNWVKNYGKYNDYEINKILNLFSIQYKDDKYHYPIVFDILNEGYYLSSSLYDRFPVLDNEQYLRYKETKAKNVSAANSLEIASKNDLNIYKRFHELIDLGISSEYVLEFINYDAQTLEKFKELHMQGIPDCDIEYFTDLNDKQKERYLKYFDGRSLPYTMQIVIENDEYYTTFTKLLEKGLTVLEACEATLLKDTDDDSRFQKFTQYLDMSIPPRMAIDFAKQEDGIELDRNINLAQRGVYNASWYFSEDRIPVSNDKYYFRVINLLENGFSSQKAIEVSFDDEAYSKVKSKIDAKDSQMKTFLNSDDYTLTVDRICKQSNYSQLLAKLLNRQTMNFNAISSLVNSNLSKEDFLENVSKFLKTYNMAMKTPNAFLSDIDISYTTTVNGKFPKLSELVLKHQQNQMNEFFANNLGNTLRLLKYTDRDTLNQLMNRRTHLCEEALKELNEITDENFEVLSKLINCENVREDKKSLSAKEKIELCRIIRAYQCSNIDIVNDSDINSMIASNKVDIKLLQDKIQIKIMEYAGISEDEAKTLIDTNAGFDSKYSYLLLQNNAPDILARNSQIELEHMTKSEISQKLDLAEIILKNIQNSDVQSIKKSIEPLKKMIDMFNSILAGSNDYSDEDVFNIYKEYYENISAYISENDNMINIIRETVRGTFSDFISDTSNIFGKNNSDTKLQFEQSGIDFEKWLMPEIQESDSNFEVNGQKFKIKLWNRDPKNDLFIGNKTTCCTAIGTGENGNATPIYLLNQAFNVAELFNEQGDMVGMSRIYMGEVDGKTSLLMDNIELNANYFKNKDSDYTTNIRNSFFHYMNKYAEQIGKEIPVYFSTSYAHVRTDDLESISSKTKFIGSITDESVYINAFMTWVNPADVENMDECEWYKVDNKYKKLLHS